MRRAIAMLVCGTVGLLVMAGAPGRLSAQGAEARYPSMAPVEQYLMTRDAEIALARSAAPESISAHADVMVLGRRGYETAVRGSNGFVCMVQRSWAAPSDDPSFWDPRARSPICFNRPAALSYVPISIKRTELVMAGRTKAELFGAMAAAFRAHELPPVAPGSMCYMMSRQGRLNGADGPWHPHLMFLVPLTEPGVWGADAPGSPVIAVKTPEDHATIFMIRVPHWSDGTADTTLVR